MVRDGHSISSLEREVNSANLTVPTAALQVAHLNLTVEVFVEHHAHFGNLTFGEEVFDLLQFHFHTPSEHRIQSEYSPVEVDFVHESRAQSMCFPSC
jgi:carbonic anhydrase